MFTGGITADSKKAPSSKKPATAAEVAILPSKTSRTQVCF